MRSRLRAIDGWIGEGGPGRTGGRASVELRASVPLVKDFCAAHHFGVGALIGLVYAHRSDWRVPTADDKRAGNNLTGRHSTLQSYRCVASGQTDNADPIRLVSLAIALKLIY
ncbi:hypothetical protein GUJ93_ZPchr0012g21674 [Zizania palustris]|uniref:Uncharacterized protein n=1 Tax=Zizania palustris TaxID=103762 RepID=A0A8J5WRK2_ZIZPA|nr:hypothetical protein GUJ93_ZPchr0012g21674 [Zizania palustris]